MKLPKPPAPTRMCLAVGLLTLLSANTQTAQAQQVQVTAAEPSAAAQATVNLDVKVTGKGFKNGAKAKFLVTGTVDPGGVQVNSTTFVSSTELRANLDVAETAIIANFDIQVLNSDGRGGKGTELFRVVAKGSNGGGSGCPAMAPAPTSDTKCFAALPGCLDITFGTNGLVMTDPSGPNYKGDSAEGLLVQTDGKIIAAGYMNGGLNATSADFVVVRYNIDGSLDTSFGDPDPLSPSLRLGYVRTPFTSGSDFGHAALLQPDGKIVVGGSGSGMTVARYITDGTLDSTFGSGGKLTVDFGSSTSVRGLAIQSDGKLILAGEAGAPSQFGLARLNPNGSLDSSFGTGGKLIVNPSNVKRGRGIGWAVAIQRIPAVTGEERIVVGGWSDYSGTAPIFTMMRFKPNGAIDLTFGSSGRVYTSFFGFGDQIRKLAIDQANRIVAAGITNTASSSCGGYVVDFAVARYTQNGALDNSFSGDGRLTTEVYGGHNAAAGLLLQPDGKIVVAGNANSSDQIVRDFALVRYNDDGTPDSSFGVLGTGVVTTDFGSPSDWSFAIAQQPWDGKIVVAGNAFDATYIALARYWP